MRLGEWRRSAVGIGKAVMWQQDEEWGVGIVRGVKVEQGARMRAEKWRDSAVEVEEGRWMTMEDKEKSISKGMKGREKRRR